MVLVAAYISRMLDADVDDRIDNVLLISAFGG
jgi:hypothetical protein